MTEVRVASLAELQPGSMRQVTVAGVEILIARVGDTVWATSANCIHYGGPLRRCTARQPRNIDVIRD